APEELPAANAVAAEPAPTPSARPGKEGRDGSRHPRLKRLRFPFRNVLRGEVTAITSTSVTVKSNDGFTLTWTFSDQLRVFERRNQIQPSAVAVGARIGVAGEKQADKPVARLIVVPKAR